MSKRRVVFVGSSKLGLRCLNELIGLEGIDVVGIVTNPKTFSISYRPQGVTNVLHADVEEVGKDRGIPVWTMAGKMSDPELVAAVRDWRPDLILVAGWYHMVPKVIREIAPCLGLHASLLPQYAGGAPLVWAMIDGKEEAGISLFRLEDGVDTGRIFGQERTPIYFRDTIATLYGRIEELALKLVRDHVLRVASGDLSGTDQDQTNRHVVPQRSPEDGKIDWSWSPLRIYNFVRAQTRPYPGAFTLVEGEKLSIWECSPDLASQSTAQPSDTEAGLVLSMSDVGGRTALRVSTREKGCPLWITDVEWQKMPGASASEVIQQLAKLRALR